MKQGKDNIEVLYALTDKIGSYSKLVGTSICSIFHNTRENVRVHIFHDGTVKGKNKENFIKLAENYGQKIIFYNVREILPEVLEEARQIMSKALNNDRYTEAALYRLLAPQILPASIERLIYLDADTLVHMDIKLLWQQAIGSNGLSAVIEDDFLKHYNMESKSIWEELEKLLKYWKSIGVEVKRYFNSGVLLMDLNKVRPMGNILLSGLQDVLACESENKFYDQNILNFYFAKGTGALPWNFNILVALDKEFVAPREVEGIYHYMGRSLKMNENDVRDTIYYDYFLKTPWADGRFLCHFHSDFKELHTVRVKQILSKMWNLVAGAGKKKTVFACSNDYSVEVCKQLGLEHNFSDVVAEQEAFCFCSLGDEEHLTLALPYDVDSHFYVFFCSDYAKVKVMLEQAGLEEKDHYTNGLFLLEEDCLEKHISLNRVFEAL